MQVSGGRHWQWGEPKRATRARKSFFAVSGNGWGDVAVLALTLALVAVCLGLSWWLRARGG